MSTLRVLVVGWVLLAILNACSNDTSEADGSTNVEYDEGSEKDDCCGVIYDESVNGLAPSGGTYLWLALEYQGRIVAYGDPVFVEGAYDTTLQVSSAYLAGLPSGTFFRRVYSTPDPHDIGVAANSVIARDALPQYIEMESKDQCSACCTRTLRRYAAWAIKDIDSLTGVSAEIMTFWGRLCPDYTKEAQTCAWVGFQNDLPPAKKTNFVQMGYIKKRWADGSVDSSVYIELVGRNTQWDYRFEYAADDNFEGMHVDPPSHGQLHKYRVVIDANGGGCLRFSFDGMAIRDLAASWWRDRTSRHASWRGEIDGRETDMPGTVEEPCTFEDCEYLTNDGVWHWAHFDDDDWIDVTPQWSDPDQWGIWHDPGGNTIKIWDEYPLGTR